MVTLQRTGERVAPQHGAVNGYIHTDAARSCRLVYAMFDMLCGGSWDDRRVAAKAVEKIESGDKVCRWVSCEMLHSNAFV